jgi:hypothetical protein
MRIGVVSILVSLMWGCGVVLSKEANLVDGYLKLKGVVGFEDCVAMSHSKKLKKLVYACSPGSVVIISTDTGNVDTIDAVMSGEQPFVYRQGDGLFLYFPGGGDRLAIREIDVEEKRVFDRPILVKPGFTYSSIYLNPRDRCMAVGLVADGSGQAVIKVYDYEPRDRTPLRVGGRGLIEVMEGQSVRVFGGPNNNRLACVRSKSGELILFSSRFESDLRPGKAGGVILRVTSEGEAIIHRGENFMEFLQPKLAPYIFARDGLLPGLMQINTETGEVGIVGDGVEGVWEDYDPLTRTGVVTAALQADAGANAGRAASRRICLADLTGCLEGHPVLATHGDLFTPSVSNGWLGDGFIATSSSNLQVDRPAVEGVNRTVPDTQSYWF